MLNAVLLWLAAFAAAPQAPTPTDLLTALTAAATESARRDLLDAQPAALTPEFQKAVFDKGVELRRASQMTAAGNAFLAAHDIAERIGLRSRAAMSLVSYSSVPGQLGDYPAAIAALDRALAIGEAEHDDAVIAAALTNFGIIYSLTGDNERSIATNLRVLSLAMAADDHKIQGRAYNELGIVYARQGHFREALDAYEKAIVLEGETSAADASLTLSNIGNVHMDQGNYELALDYYSKALATLRRLNNAETVEITVQLNNIASVERELGRLDAALEHFQQARAINERLGNRVGIGAALYNIASVRESQGRNDEALDGYRQSLALRETLNDRVGIRTALHAIGMLDAARGRTADALAAEERAVEIARGMQSNELLWEPLRVIGDLQHRLHHDADAERAYRESIAVIEAIRTEVAGGSESRRRFFHDKLASYHGLTTLLMEQQRNADALTVAERARGRVLAELVEGPEPSVAALTPAEREQQRALERNAVMLAASLAATQRRRAADAAAVQQATERLSQARRASDVYRDALDAKYPTRRLARGDEPPDPVGAAGLLMTDARTAIIEYVVTGEATQMFVLTASGDGPPSVASFTTAITKAALKARVEGLTRKLSKRALDFHADAAALYGLLLKPASGVLAGKTRLVIVPDDLLWTLPFGVLEASPGRVLLDQASISYAPSITVLRAMRERHAALESAGGALRIVIAADPASDLPKLPDAQRQALTLSTLYGAGRSRALVGANATEPRVRAAAADGTILHFATHGVVDDTNPMYSYLQLTRSGEVDAETDGRLEAWEILSLKLKAAVAVLTACDTARGAVGGGEGVVGLAWAFFAAGTPATIVSLWQLESGSATTMTLGFHRRFRASLLAGHGEVADSLRAAALELRRDPRYRHPFYWAGFVAVGDGY